MKESLTNPPILFIAQRTEPNLTLKAQSYYYHQFDSDNHNQETAEKEIDETEASLEKGEKTSRFHEKTIDEKLDYLTESTGILPKLKCKIITNETSYNGTVESYDDTSVELQLVHLRRRIRINKEDIQEILLVGF